MKAKVLLVFLVLFWFSVPNAGQGQSGSSEVKRYLIAPLGWQGEPGSEGSLEWVTTITLHNLTDSLKSVKIANFDDSGRLVELQYKRDGEKEVGIGQRAFLQVNAGRTLTFSNIAVRPTVTGVIEFVLPATDGKPEVEVEATYQLFVVDKFGEILASIVSADANEPNKSFRAHVVSTKRAETGLAVYNPQDLPVDVELSLYNTYSKQTYDIYTYKFSAVAKVSFSLGPRQVISRFIKEIFQDLPNDSVGNKVTDGDVQISASLPVTVAASRVDFNQDRSLYSAVRAIPVEPKK